MNEREETLAWIQCVLERHEARLVSYAHRLLGDLDQARDVVQDTFLRLLDRGLSLRHGPPEALAAWLVTTCRRRALDHKRRGERMRKREERVGSADPRSADDDDPARALEAEESRRTLLRLLDELPEKQQEAVRLRFQMDLSYREIAEVTGASVGNVGFLLHQAVQTLRRRVRSLEGSLGR